MRKWVLWIIAAFFGVIFVVALTMAVSARLQQNKIKKVSDTFVSEILGDDAKNSYNLQSDNARQQLTSAEWSQTVDKVSTFFKGNSATLTSSTYSSNYAFFTYKISGSDGNYIFKIALTPTNKQWQVQSFKSELTVN